MSQTQILLVVIPLAIVQLSLLILAVVDLLKDERAVRGGSKALWAVIIVFVNILGPLLYFFVGREEGKASASEELVPPAAGRTSQFLSTWPTLANDSAQAIETHGLSKRFGRVLALENLDLAVPRGSIFGFLGPNGAGKTTTLRLLTGLAQPSSGSATVAGVAATAGDGRLTRNIGYLDQDPRFYGWMTGRELLEFVGRLYDLHGYELSQRVGDVLEIIGLGEAANRRLGGYSGGMRQRLGIGQALINRPQVLFLDEPVSSLDPEGRREILALIDGLRGKATVVLCSHILGDVERVCDQVAILNLGHLVAQGPIDDLLDRYAQPVYELQPEAHVPDALARLSQALSQQPWVAQVSSTPDSVRVFVTDPKQAAASMIQVVAATNVPLVRFERMRPTLEDVFVRLVARPELNVVPQSDIPVTGLDGRGRR